MGWFQTWDSGILQIRPFYLAQHHDTVTYLTNGSASYRTNSSILFKTDHLNLIVMGYRDELPYFLRGEGGGVAVSALPTYKTYF